MIKHATYNGFAVTGVRKTNTDGLIDPEHVCVGSPRIFVVKRVALLRNCAWAIFHEQTHAGNAARTCVKIVMQQPRYALITGTCHHLSRG